MKKRYTTGKTASFSAYDSDNKEYIIDEFTHFEHRVSEQSTDKISIATFYKTSTGIHVQADGGDKFHILSNYGEKNIIVNRHPSTQ